MSTFEGFDMREFQNCFLPSMHLQVSGASAAASWQQQIVLHCSFWQLWPPPGWSIRRELRERRGNERRWEGEELGRKMWKRISSVGGWRRERIKLKNSERTDWNKKQRRPRRENETSFRPAISQPCVSGSQTLRTSRLSLTTVQRGGRREWRHTHIHCWDSGYPSAKGSLGLDTEEGISFHTLLG